ncbi:hypothetical protein QLQ12_27900 [Actinoplanes sp. NEAU-A12]|uniref:NACHT domain-containing protein n=1 Tax=Actinoplanes sandaracinus TaxID=3045177 RepID=A0ABT6WRX3_9ACTN|nr:hypothetical protein [Actinoplanes sandaracinus]MDI6102449.1 hypothetical protein [Actinoplanes sandaracinus]
MFRAVMVVVAVGSATWMIVQAIRGDFDLWAPLGVVISVLSLIGDAAERRRQRLLPGPSVNELAAVLADILDRKCRAEVADRGLLDDPGLLPVAWTEVKARAPNVRVDEARPDQRIRKRFEDATFRLAELFRNDPAGRLVVLGQPGAGKSVLALTLQAGLLKSRFDRPADEPVPALVSVASWNPLGVTLDDFLVDALARAHYGGSPDHPRSLLDAGRVLPILDGLDEIPEFSRAAAVTAVNEAIGRHGWPLVVTCRLVEYEDLIHGGAPPLRRSTVIRVLPVQPRDAIAYLKAAASTDASAWAGVFAEIERPGSPVAEAYSTPLMVSIAQEVYGRLGRDPREQLDASLDSRLAVENNLLDRLVDAAYPSPDGPQPQERPAGRWPKEKASRYLTALARYLYDAQERDLRWWDLADRLLPAGTGALLGTVIGLLMMVASLVCFAVAGGGAAGSAFWTSALVGFLFLVFIMSSWSVESAPPSRLPTRPFSAAAIREAFAVTPTLGVLMWIPFALVSAVAITAIDGWSVSSGELFLQSMGLASALLVAFAVALSAHRWLLAAPAAARLDSPRAVLRQDRTSALVSAAASGLVFALLLTPLGLIAAAFGSAVYGWTTGGAGWLQGAQLSDIVQARLLDVVPGYFATWPVAVWLLVVVPGLLLGTYLLVSRAWFRLQIARVLLAGNRVLPWRLLGLLEDAGRRELLRQSGGAYQFRHLRLQERLADDQSAAYYAVSEAARRRARRRRRILVPALIVAFLASLAVPLTAAPRDSADAVLRLPYGRFADDLVVSPDGETLATTSTDGVRLWRLDNVGVQDDPYFIATAGDDVRDYFNPSGRLFFVRDSVPSAAGPDADAEPRVRVWRWAARGWEQLGPARPPEAVVLLAGGAKVGLLSATDGRANATLTVHSADGGPARPIPGRFADDLGETQPPEYDADGTSVDLVERRFVLGGKDDGSLTVWDTAADPPSSRVIAQPGGGPSEALVDPAGRHMVVRTESGAKLFDLSRGTSVPLPFRETKSELRFDPTGTWLAGSSGTRENDATDDRMVTVWNAADGRQQGSWTLGGDVVDFDFVPGVSALIVETAEQDSGYQALQVLPVSGGPASPPVTGASGYTLYQTRPKPILVVPRVRPDAPRGQRDSVDILDAASGALLHSVAVPGALEQADAWSPRPDDDEGQPPPIVASTADGGRMAWNSVTGQELGIGGRVDWVDHLPSPPGTVIAGKSDGRLAIYDARTGALEESLIRSLPPPSDVDSDFGPIGALFNADGRFLAAPARDGAIEVWDLAGPSRSIELNGHSGKLETFAWGCQKTRETLISAGAADSTIRLWRL